MCIIIVKPAGVEFPTEQIFKNCWSSNRDGFGAMWRTEDGSIQIDKGYMTERAVIDWREKYKEKLLNTDVVMHFRFGTHGTNTAGNTHPFPLSNCVDDLRRLWFKCERGLAHNGVLNEFGRDKSTLSDTMIFVKYLSNMHAKTFVGTAISRQFGKFVLLTEHDTLLFGDFNDDKGIFYSNYGWRTSTVTVYGGGFGKWGADYDDYCSSHARASESKSTGDNTGIIKGCDGNCLKCDHPNECVLMEYCNLDCENCELIDTVGCVFDPDSEAARLALESQGIVNDKKKVVNDKKDEVEKEAGIEYVY